MSKRREVTSIKITFEGNKPDYEWTLNNDPKKNDLPLAIVFTDEGVKSILKPFYVGKDIKIKKDKVENEWGKKITTKVFNSDKEKKIDDKVIDDAWKTPDDDDLMLPMLRKVLECPFI